MVVCAHGVSSPGATHGLDMVEASILWGLKPAAEKSWRRRLLEPVLRVAAAAACADAEATASCSSTALVMHEVSVASRWLAPFSIGGPPRQLGRLEPLSDKPTLAVVPAMPAEQAVRPSRHVGRWLVKAERKPCLTRMAVARQQLALELGSGLTALTSGEEVEIRSLRKVSPRPPSPLTVAEALYTRDNLGKNASLFRGNLDAEVEGRNAEFAEMANHRVDSQRAMQQFCREQAIKWREDKSRQGMVSELRWKLANKSVLQPNHMQTEGTEPQRAAPTPEPDRPGVALLPDFSNFGIADNKVGEDVAIRSPKNEAEAPTCRKTWTVKPKRSLQERNKLLVNLRTLTVVSKRATEDDDKTEKRRRRRQHRESTLRRLRSEDNATIPEEDVALSPEMQNFSRVFRKYDKDHSGGLDADELKGVLQDLGLKAKNEMEREAIRRVLQKCCDFEVTFDDLVHKLVPEVRESLAEVKREHLREVFEQADKDFSGSLSVHELVLALRRMNIFPSQEQVQESVKDVVPHAMSQMCGVGGDLNVDANVVTWEYFEALATRLEEIVERARVMRSEDICRLLGLTAKQQEHWKHNLTDIHDAFHLYCDTSTETMNCSMLINLVRDLNMVPWKRGEALTSMLNITIRDYNGSDAGLEFSQVLSILERLRQRGEDFLRGVFRSHTTSGHGGLSLADARAALKEAGIAPSNVEEARDISDWMEEFDEDGTGQLDQLEFTLLANFIADRLPKYRREKERQLGYRYGWTELVFDRHRTVFIKFDTDMSETLDGEELTNAIAVVRPGWIFEELMSDVSRLRSIDFTTFMQLIKYHDNVETQRQLCMAAGIDKTFSQVLCNVWKSLEPSVEDNFVMRVLLQEYLTVAYATEKNATLKERNLKRIAKLALLPEIKHIKFADFMDIMKRTDLDGT